MNGHILNRINENLNALKNSNDKPFYKKGDFYVGLFFGIISIILSIVALVQTKTLSQQQQQIKGFDTLLKNSKTQTDTLNKAIQILSSQLSILSSQLKLNEEQQKLLNLQAGYSNNANESKFRLAEYNLRLLIWSPNLKFHLLTDWDSTSRKEYLLKAQNIIGGELNNPFLLNSDTLNRRWNETFGKISNYYFVSTFDATYQNPIELKKELDFTWRNCFLSIADLWQFTNRYLAQITYHGSKKSTYKTWYYNSADTSFDKQKP